jgi:DNA replication and repair protein RecF
VLSVVEVTNFRCIESACLDLDARSTGILGENASGKTSFLEAIYVLAHGRSFRTAQREALVRTGESFFRVVGHIQAERGEIVAGVEYADGRSRVNVGGRAADGIAAVTEILPVQIIDPGVHRLVEEGSARRRRLLDWGVFHVKHEFLFLWRRYQRALQQRNAALRTGNQELVAPWEAELIATGPQLDHLRAEYAGRLEPHFTQVAGRLLEASQAAFEYRRGWADDRDLGQALQDCWRRDLRLRTTTAGPHRADVSFLVDGTPARERVSRGQQKLLAAAFVLAQLSLRAAEGAPRACLMLDDPAAELDVDNLGKLFAVIAEIPAQLIITSVEERGLRGIPIGRTFHVKQGRLL